MENIAAVFNQTYLPKKALIIYQSEHSSDHIYVEAYDMDWKGNPINAHPLSVKETVALAECLNTSAELKNNYLKSKGLLPEKVLYIHPAAQGFAIWYTPEQEVDLLFTESLQVNSGKGFVPPLLWKADKNNLTLYALKDSRKPSLKEQLFRAPFFNLYHDNKVCMGTVDKGMENVTCLEDFIARWEHCYWNSYFSHMIEGISPVKGNIIQLWQQQVNTGKKFPLDVLVKEAKTIKDLIV